MELNGKKLISNRKLRRLLKNKKLLKTAIIAAVTTALSLYFQDTAFADGRYKYDEPVQLNPVFDFIDWLIFIIRLVSSLVIGLISTVAGYKWGTDISGSGQTEAKKILKNGAIGLFWIWAGTTITAVFVNKLEELLS